ncbi:MAG: hypothetical protein GTO45_40460 [Candidatus Aminicenantes bacterium]|nr:hypothetical protein [Candidatus Aminicenantes bacterium]NIM84882.1 hypothetical protein [Candidatus Aminicenantes bacterium]NIN24390.1 hypothetical protein [Candidatus Aminicenantes bacterium]NIN48154.1 hypothetical protein [Candidatus Aminicenantes bacterium]NIN91057.1 hypothetical protein [Candidatus Aminicenantes bacterium]
MKSFKTSHVGYWLFALLLVLFLLSPGYTAATEENLVSNVDGKIRVVIFHYGNGAYFLGFWFDETVLFRDLMDKMDKDG